MATITPAVTQTINQITPEIHNTAPITGFVTIAGVTIYPMFIVLVLVLATFGYFLWRGQRDSGRNTFDAWDLIMDTLPDSKRRASGIKTTYQTAFIVSTFVVVDQELKGVLNSTIFGLYLATWCASLITKVVFDGKNAPEFKIPGDAK